MITLRTASTIIDVLGGNQSVAEITASKATAVANWRYSNDFPSNTYVALQAALAERGYTAPDALWKMRLPAAARRQKNGLSKTGTIKRVGQGA